MGIDGVAPPDVGAAKSLPATTAAGSGDAAPAAPPPLLDRLSIQPLDVAGALQILIAEVKADFSELLNGAAPAAATAPAAPVPATPSLITVPPLLVGIYLQAVADADSPALWLANVAQARGILDTAFNRTLEAVNGWQQVPQHVVAVVKDARAVVVAALDDDPPNACWLRPEWLSLGPRMGRFKRLRRRMRRLLDPDADRQPGHDDRPRE